MSTAETHAVADLIDRAAVEDFFYREAAILDEWRLLEWLELFTADCRYEIPSLDIPDNDVERTFSLIHDGPEFLRQRVVRLMKPTAHAEFPQSRTRRLITNVRILGKHGTDVMVTANFSVHRIDVNSHNEYIGRYEYVLVAGRDGLKIKHRKAILDHFALQPQGKISIIL